LDLTLGDDALVVLWDLDTGAKLQDISSPFNGPITAVVWLPTAQGSATAFAFGCADGSIHVYVQQPHQVSSFEVLAAELTFHTIRKITRSHPLPVPTVDPLKISLSNSLTAGLLAWVMVLCKFGS